MAMFIKQSSPRSSQLDCLQETYVLHDGPPYANGELHIGIHSIIANK